MIGRILSALMATALLFGATAAWGDDHDNDYARLWMVDARPGQFNEFIAAFTDHLKWRKENGDPWTWMTMTSATGGAINSIFVRSGNHTLAEMDAYQDFGAKAGEHWMANVDQYVKNYTTWITRTDDEMEYWPDDLKFSLIQVVTYHVKPGHGREFNDTMKAFHEGLRKVNWPEPYAISRLVSGGPGNQVTLVLPYENYADMADPEVPFPAALTEAYGKKKAEQLMETFANAYTSSDEMLLKFEPVLSLLPDD